MIAFPFTVEQGEDGAWSAAAHLRPGVGAVGDGPTREATVADLRTRLEPLLDEFGMPGMMVAAPPPGQLSGNRSRRIDYYDDAAAPEAKLAA